MLALVDEPNGNVGFEIGLALGLGKPVLLASAYGAPDWVQRAPFAGSVFATGCIEVSEARALLERDWTGLCELPGPRPTRGQGTLLLCPKEGPAEAHYLRAGPRGWPELDAHGWTGGLGRRHDECRHGAPAAQLLDLMSVGVRRGAFPGALLP